jgi:hypothetical protein
MRESADSAWMKFSAHQRIDLAACALEWKARTGPLGVIRVDDRFCNGSGGLAVTLFGLLKIAGAAKSISLDRGELLRYLAEPAWLPTRFCAIAHRDGATWMMGGWLYRPERLSGVQR